MTRHRLALLVASALALTLVGCGSRSAPRTGDEAKVAHAAEPTPTAAPTPTATPAPRSAPTKTFQVATRELNLSRGNRKLPTTIWYPRSSTGRFPVVIFSHGLTGLPTSYTPLVEHWASAGFIVAGAAYPHTSLGAPDFQVADVANQPADASYVLTKVLALNTTAGDPLRGRIDTGHLAAAGHSAGAITTVGLFAAHRDARLDAGIVLAGNAVGMGSTYVGAPASLLFVHGDADNTTPYNLARVTYQAIPKTWKSAFLTFPGGDHINPYLNPATPDYAAMRATTTDFLRWALYGDAAASARLPKDAGRGNRLERRL
jgi:fermentation-respiration switch protein FrsA (DUF1100 family)